jgi:RNA polymerase sigma-70 factor (ECF subfamily)
VREALEVLPAEQRLVIEMSYFKGLTQAEIAERTGQPLGTVKTRMRLALRKLRGALGKEVDKNAEGWTTRTPKTDR